MDEGLITTLDPAETQSLLIDHRYARTSTMSKLTKQVLTVIDTDQSVFVAGITEGQTNSLRTAMYRRNIVLTIRKVEREGIVGYVVQGRTIQPEEQG